MSHRNQLQYKECNEATSNDSQKEFANEGHARCLVPLCSRHIILVLIFWCSLEAIVDVTVYHFDLNFTYFSSNEKK